MGHLSAPEHQGDLDLVHLLQKIPRVLHLEVEVMFACEGPEFDLLQMHSLLMEFCRMVFLVLRILKFSKIEDPTNGRIGGGRDFYQVQGFFFRFLQRVLCQKDANLIPVTADETNLLNPYFPIDP